MITTRIGFNLYLSKNWFFFSLVVGEAQNQKQWNFHTWVDSGEASETDKVRVLHNKNCFSDTYKITAGPYKHKSLLFSPFFLFVNSDQIFILKKLIHNPLLINKTFHQFRCKKKGISKTESTDYTTNYKQTSNSVTVWVRTQILKTGHCSLQMQHKLFFKIEFFILTPLTILPLKSPLIDFIICNSSLTFPSWFLSFQSLQIW